MTTETDYALGHLLKLLSKWQSDGHSMMKAAQHEFSNVLYPSYPAKTNPFLR